MAIRSILVPATEADDCPPRLEAAIGLGLRLEAHVRLLFLHDDPNRTYRNLPEVIRAAGVTAEQIDREIHDEASRCRAALEVACSRAGIRCDGSSDLLRATFGTWEERSGILELIVAAAARTSDLLVVTRPETRLPNSDRILDTALFASGRPTLVLCGAPPADLLRHVVIAWNGSLEGARLVGHALDALHAAARVSIVTGAERDGDAASAEELRRYLSWHGIQAHRIVAAHTARSVADDIVAAAAKADASLLAMGAYTHSRIRQLFLGGLTRVALEQSGISLLMEH